MEHNYRSVADSQCLRCLRSRPIESVCGRAEICITYYICTVIYLSYSKLTETVKLSILVSIKGPIIIVNCLLMIILAIPAFHLKTFWLACLRYERQRCLRSPKSRPSMNSNDTHVLNHTSQTSIWTRAMEPSSDWVMLTRVAISKDFYK